MSKVLALFEAEQIFHPSLYFCSVQRDEHGWVVTLIYQPDLNDYSKRYTVYGDRITAAFSALAALAEKQNLPAPRDLSRDFHSIFEMMRERKIRDESAAAEYAELIAKFPNLVPPRD